MKGTSERQESGSCRRARDVFERMVLEEPVSHEEQSQFKEHLNACCQCERLYRVTHAFPQLAEEAAEGNYDADINLVLQTLETQRRQHKKQLRWGLLIAAAAIPLLTILLGTYVARQDTATLQSHIGSATCLPVSPEEVLAGIRVTHCKGDQLSTKVSNGVVEISLHQGTVALSVNPNRPNKNRVSVFVPTGEVQVKGTLFAVHTDNDTDHGVEVFRGTVSVIPKDSTVRAFHVTSGFGSAIERDSAFNLNFPKSRVLIDALNVNEATQKKSNGGALRSASDPLEDADEEKLSASDRDNIQHGVKNGVPNGLSSQPAFAGANRTAKEKSMDSLIEDARACLLKQDWHCAASEYNRVLKKYARLPESNAVLISLAKIELRHLNKPQRALKHYNKYLKKMPAGPLAEEALLGVASAYRQLKQEEKEKQALLRYVRKYPRSALKGKAQSRLQQLGVTTISTP